MKGLRIFFWVTAIVYSLGGLDLMSTFEFDVYSLWAIVVLWCAVYYAEKMKQYE